MYNSNMEFNTLITEINQFQQSDATMERAEHLAERIQGINPTQLGLAQRYRLYNELTSIKGHAGNNATLIDRVNEQLANIKHAYSDEQVIERDFRERLTSHNPVEQRSLLDAMHIFSGMGGNAEHVYDHIISTIQEQQDLSALRTYLADSQVDVNACPTHASSHMLLLEAAIAARNTEAVKILLECGANVNQKPPIAGSILMRAIQSSTGNPEMVKILLDHGADSQVVTGDNASALSLAVNQYFRNMDIALLLLPYTSPDTVERSLNEWQRITLCDCLQRSQDPQVIKAAIRLDQQLRTQHWEPLQEAARNPRWLQLLSTLGPQLLEYRNRDGQTLIHFIAKEGNYDAMQSLRLTEQALVDALRIPDANLRTPFMEAARCGQHEFLRQALNSIQDAPTKCSLVTQPDRQSDTAVHLAAADGHHRVATLLAQHAPNAYMMSGRAGLTPAMQALVNRRWAYLREWMVGEIPGWDTIQATLQQTPDRYLSPKGLKKDGVELIGNSMRQIISQNLQRVQDRSQHGVVIMAMCLKALTLDSNIFANLLGTAGSQIQREVLACITQHSEDMAVLARDMPEVLLSFLTTTDQEHKPLLLRLAKNPNSITFFQTMAAQQPAFLNKLLNQKLVDVEERTTILHVAAENDYVALLDVLSPEQLQIACQLTSSLGATPWLTAVTMQKEAFVARLLERVADPDQLMRSGAKDYNAAHFAMLLGNSNLLETLKTKSGPLYAQLMRQKAEQITPLVCGIQERHWAVLQQRYPLFANLFEGLRTLEPPAATSGEGLSPEALTLIAAFLGAHATDPAISILTLLQTTAEFGSSEILTTVLEAAKERIDALLENSNELTVLLQTDPNLLEILLTHPDSDGNTRLAECARIGHNQLFTALRQTPAFYEKMLLIQDKNGDTVSHTAVRAGNASFFRGMTDAQLQKALQIQNRFQESVLHVAAACGRSELLELFNTRAKEQFLRTCKAKDEMGRTAFHVAAYFDQAAFLKALFSLTPDLCQSMIMVHYLAGETGLHLAAKSGALSIFTLLQRDFPDLFRELMFQPPTPLSLALKEKQWDIVRHFYPNFPEEIVELNPERDRDRIRSILGEDLIGRINTQNLPLREIFEVVLQIGDERLFALVAAGVRDKLDALISDPDILRRTLKKYPQVLEKMLTMPDQLGVTRINQAAADSGSTLFQTLAKHDPAFLAKMLQSSDGAGDSPAHCAARRGNMAFFELLKGGVLLQELRRKNRLGEQVMTLIPINKQPQLLSQIKELFKSQHRHLLIDLLKAKNANGESLAHRMMRLANVGGLEWLKLLYSCDKALFMQMMRDRNTAGQTPLAIEIILDRREVSTWLAHEVFPQLLEALQGTSGGPQLDTHYANAVARRLVTSITAVPSPALDLEPLLIAELLGSDALWQTLNEGLALRLDLLLRNREALTEALKDPKLQLILQGRDREGRTALHRAALADSAAVFEILAQEEPDRLVTLLNLTDNEGNTPLFSAAENGKIDALRALHQHAPKILRERLEERAGNGDTVLTRARRMGQEEFERALLAEIELPTLQAEKQRLEGLLGRPVAEMGIPQSINSLRQAQTQLLSEIKSLRAEMRKNDADLRRRGIKPPFFLPSDIEMSQALLTRTHLSKGVATAPIPPADPSIKIEKLIKFLESVEPQLEGTLDDEEEARDEQDRPFSRPVTRAKTEIIERFRQTIQGYASDRPVYDALNNMLTPNYKTRVVNVLRHLTKMLEDEENAIESPEQRRHFEAEVHDILYYRFGVAFFHCLDHTAPLCQNLYFNRIAPSRDFQTAQALPNQTLLKLLNFRRHCFEISIAMLGPDRHGSDTQSHYYRQMSGELGLGSNEISVADTLLETVANKGHETEIRTNFNRQVNASTVLELICRTLNDPKDKSLRSMQVQEWFQKEWDVDVQQLYLPDGTWNPKAILRMLQHPSINVLTTE